MAASQLVIFEQNMTPMFSKAICCWRTIRIEWLRSRTASFLAALVIVAGIAGCGDSGPQLAPATGKVMYKGKPVPFGSVQFQPIEGGQFARGDIQPDGTFELNTTGAGEGAVVGKNRVRITSFESQNPAATASFQPAGGEPIVGRSLIPRRYNSFGSSGLEAEVLPEKNEPFVFELTDRD